MRINQVTQLPMTDPGGQQVCKWPQERSWCVAQGVYCSAQ